MNARAQLVLAAALALGAVLTAQERPAAPAPAPAAAPAAKPQEEAAPPAVFAPEVRYLREAPYGLPPLPAPPAAHGEDVFELGRSLFAEPLLSIDRTVSCASCHPAATGFASNAKLPAGVHGRLALRHAPALWNRAYGSAQRWDGGSATLEQFVLEPIEDEREMALPLAQALERLRADAGYRARFAAAFPDGVSAPNLSAALATFVRGIVRGDAPVDRFQRGDTEALRSAERAGLWLFESKAGCWQCHPPPLFTDESFHATGIGVVAGEPEPGRAARTRDAADTGRFKTPTVRGVALTAPYMHDGSLATLEEVVEFYARGGNPHAQLDPRMKPLALDAKEKASLVAFLKSL